MNAPNAFESFMLEDGQSKLLYEKDTKMMDAGTFTLCKEDHTIGNLIRMQLLRDPRVLFAGYKIPHPLEYDCVVKIRTTGVCEPPRALADSIKAISGELDILENKFTVCQESNEDIILLILMKNHPWMSDALSFSLLV